MDTIGRYSYLRFNAARSILCGATREGGRESIRQMFQCRTQHFMWCNKRVTTVEFDSKFQCRTQHFMWCNLGFRTTPSWRFSFNAARSILCGATPSLAALVPRGARGRFGKSSIFCAVSPLWGGIFTEKSRRQSASSLVRRGVAPKWKIATVECGFAASPSHFPLFCTMSVS